MDIENQKVRAPKVRESETYICHNAGCENGKGSEFEDAPAEVFEEKGLSTPKSCHDCRAWRKEQKLRGTNGIATDIVCKICTEAWHVTAEKRISYHKSEGSWDEYEHAIAAGERPCEPCEENPHRKQRMCERKALATYDPTVNPNAASAWSSNLTKATELGVIGKNTAIKVPLAKQYYTQFRHKGGNELDHILKEEHGFSELLGTNDPDVVINTLAMVANSTDETTVVVRTKSSNNELLTIKVDLIMGVVVFLKGRKNAPGEMRIHTGYVCADPVKTLRKKLKERNWFPLD